MLDYLQKFIKDLPIFDEKTCFAMGYDCEMNGADERNCHFRLFSSKENTKAWERGKEQARLDKERHE